MGPQVGSDLVEGFVVAKCPCRLDQGPEMVGEPLVMADPTPEAVVKHTMLV
jgi:hypothetical protein